ncbi:MAG: MarP family serine protease [Solirubrobacterales bacterium]|nr:MarP family serine protease [Solirubrobacterales bacterium]
MLIVDLIAGGLLLIAAVWGYFAGVARVLALVAFAIGAFLGARFAPRLLNEGDNSSFALVVAFPAALLLGGLLAAIVDHLTFKLRRRLRSIGIVSSLGGALLAAASTLVIVWLIGAVISPISSVREKVDGSTIVGNINDTVEPPGPLPKPEFKPVDPFPVAPDPGVKIAAPNPDIIEDANVQQADGSVVKVVTRQRCGGGVQGTGWFARGGVVVTNAHVVAAADFVTVSLRGIGASVNATPIWFDPDNDFALLRVPELMGVQSLKIVSRPRAGTSGALIGFPSGTHRIRPIRIGPTRSTYRGRISSGLPREFDRGLAGRLLMSFRGRADPGSSGGPIVDGKGRVLATAVIGSDDSEGGFGVPNRFVQRALGRAGPEVKTGSCGPRPTTRRPM